MRRRSRCGPSIARGRAAALLLVLACACGGRGGSAPDHTPGGAADPAALLEAARRGDTEAARRQLDDGAPVEATDERGRTPLILAARGGHVAVAELLLARKARIDAREYSGRTAFLAAVAAGRAAAAQRLLEAGADAKDELPPWTALRLASFAGLDGVVEGLLARGVDVNGADIWGLDALMYAAGRGHVSVVERLLAAGADVGRRDRRGNTALMFAAGSGEAAAARALLAAGSDGKARNRARQSARDLAAANGHGAVGEILAGGEPRSIATAAVRETAVGSPAFDEDAYFSDAARRAWDYVQAGYRPATGLVDATSGWPNTTMWDTGSAIAAHYSARELGLLPEAEYKSRIARTLRTLAALPLFEGVTYDRQYSTEAVGPGPRAGWSPTDLGRLFLWLKIVAERDPDLAAAAEAAVRRTKTAGVLDQGFMWGARADGRPFQEGRLGYEQYAAAGFSAWGFPVENAKVLARYAIPIRVLGQPVLADLRGDDRLTSDPLVLLGMEVGWTPATEALGKGVLAAQEERWRRSGRVTIVGEDAIAIPPHFFYYYCVYNHGREFAVDVQDPDAAVSGPRWVSAKNAFAWHALLPSDYTRLAVQEVRPARTRRGWASGVHEEDGRSTGTQSINTQAVILEAALYRKRRQPFYAGLRAGGSLEEEP